MIEGFLATIFRGPATVTPPPDVDPICLLLEADIAPLLGGTNATPLLGGPTVCALEGALEGALDGARDGALETALDGARLVTALSGIMPVVVVLLRRPLLTSGLVSADGFGFRSLSVILVLSGITSPATECLPDLLVGFSIGGISADS